MPTEASSNTSITRIHQLLDRWIASQPEAPAVEDDTVALNYRSFDEAARSAAAQLQEIGVRPGDRVLVIGENCVAQAVFTMALSRLNAWTILGNARLSDREIDVFIEHARPRRVLYTHAVSADAKAHGERHGATVLDWTHIGEVSVGSLNETTPVEPVSESASEQVAAMIYTSGTSGAPKGVMLTHANLLFTARMASSMRNLSPDDRSYCVLPMAHVIGLAPQFLGSMAGGCSVLFESRFSPAKAIKALETDGLSIFVGVPALYARLLEWLRAEGKELKAPKLRFISVAGSPLTTDLKATVESVFGLPVQNGYGLTECGPTVAQTRIDDVRTDCSVGHVIDGVKIRLVDKEGQEVAEGEIGELWVQTPGLMKGYYLNPEATAAAVNQEGWFNTGDLVSQESDGSLNVVGRSKELIIRSGLNVYPVEVEQAINAHPDVVQSAVVGRPAGHNEEVVAFVERVAGSELDAATLSAFLRESLAPYKVPTECRFPEALPASPTGKVLKNKLADLAKTPG